MAWDFHPEWRGPLTPDLWLDIATYELAPAAKGRVKGEYLAYLEDARAAGESVREVLKEWGDPHQANRQLRKAHLTTLDRQFLHPGYALSAAGWRQALADEPQRSSLATPFLTYVFYATLAQATGSVAQALILALTAILLIPTLRWLTIAGLRLAGKVRVVAFWVLSSRGFMVSTIGALGWWKGWDTLIVGVFAVVAALWSWRLWMGLIALQKQEGSH